MSQIEVRFVIGEVSNEEIQALKDDRAIICKMILSLDDYKLFRYKEGDSIEVETPEGNRVWCLIHNLEILENAERVILIFTLQRDNSE